MSSFPQPFTSTVSHWQATNRGPDTFYDHGRDADLPTDEVEYVIIGGGMTGASLSYALTQQGATKVVLLEAKDLASGASGRNGGHIAPFSFLEFNELITPLKQGGAGLTEDEALEVMDLERQNLNYVTETVKDNAWEVDLWRGQKVQVSITEASAEHKRAARDVWVKAHRRSRFRHMEPDWELIDDPIEAKKVSRLDKAVSLSRGPAGSVHPHKLASHFLKGALDSGHCDFYSWCPVKSFTRAEAGSSTWTVDCGDRGIIKAKRVIVCTNAHTRHLFKGDLIDKHITPYQAQAANVTPPPTYSGENSLAHTYTIEDGPYLISTPHSGIVLGIPEEVSVSNGLADKNEIYEVVDDSYVKPEIAKWLGEYCQKNYTGWGSQAPGEGALRVWSGIICSTRDMLPLVGEVPSKEGVWICAGFHGHGMARIPHLTRCLANTILSGSWDKRIPRSFEITEDRLKLAQTSPPFVTQGELRGKSWYDRMTGKVEPMRELPKA